MTSQGLSIHTQHFNIEGRYLGSCTRRSVVVCGQYQQPASFAFFCGRCANLWARCPVDQSYNSPDSDWVVWRRPCWKCRGHSGEVPGSLMLPWDPDFSEAFPDAVVRWEFDQHMRFAESIML